MNIRELTNRVVEPRMEQINHIGNIDDNKYIEKMMREAVNAAVTQNLLDVHNGEDSLLDMFEELLEALEDIAKGKGSYNSDPLTHATNTINEMIATAEKAIAKAKEIQE